MDSNVIIILPDVQLSDLERLIQVFLFLNFFMLVVAKDVSLLQYIYKGKITVSQEQLLGLLEVASVFKIKGKYSSQYLLNLDLEGHLLFLFIGLLIAAKDLDMIQENGMLCPQNGQDQASFPKMVSIPFLTLPTPSETLEIDEPQIEMVQINHCKQQGQQLIEVTEDQDAFNVEERIISCII